MDTDLDNVGILQLFDTLPHRYPFLLIDKIVGIDADNAAVGIKNVTVSEPHFSGHFPGRPIMPGVLLIEGMAQTASAICTRMMPAKPDLCYIVGIDKARFRKPVIPGDRIEYHVRKRKRLMNVWKFQCEALVDGASVAEADINIHAMLPDRRERDS